MCAWYYRSSCCLLAVGYGPFSLCVIHKEGLCPSSGDINRLMMMMIYYLFVGSILRVLKKFEYAELPKAVWEKYLLFNSLWRLSKNCSLHLVSRSHNCVGSAGRWWPEQVLLRFWPHCSSQAGGCDISWWSSKAEGFRWLMVDGWLVFIYLFTHTHTTIVTGFPNATV
jgi:hypothetical protein